MSYDKPLIIVESPAKARTLSKFLGNKYNVLASFGHVSDLPKSKLGFDPNNDFKPEFNVSPDKIKIVKEIKSKINTNTVVYLATDDDREGSAIAMHIVDILKLKKEQVRRVVFHEITEKVILESLANPTEIDYNLSWSAVARRILDRAVGYTLSPLLWKKVKYGLSAGRVQSAAVKIIVDRENEINNFIPDEFWKLKLDVLSDPTFKAELSKIDNKVTKVKNKTEADIILDNCKNYDYTLENVEEKDSTRFPPPPFTTSTLQQVASSKAGFGVKLTMTIAQKLYEGSISIPNHTGGLITYMRTDSLNLSLLATTAAREVIISEYGNEYALSFPRVYKNKNKGAQEAHEAIRPVDMSIKPSDISSYLEPRELKLYSLIWSRTMATQMALAKVANTTYRISGGNKKQYEFIAKGTKIIFPGFMKAYAIGSNDTSENNDDEKYLPNVPQGTVFTKTELTAEQNYTKPPARYNEAGLVKKLEQEGVGRPSTYASTISTILNREYVEVTHDKKLAPTMIGTAVSNYLAEHFPDIVDVKFTAGIESEFDKIAEGKIKWQTVMHGFYDSFVESVKSKEGSDRVQYSEAKVIGVDRVTNLPVSIKVGQYGTYVQLGVKEEGSAFKPKVAPVPKGKPLEEVTLEDALSYLEYPKKLGVTASGINIVVNTGKFGPYIQVDKQYYSIKPNDEYNLYTITLDIALSIINKLNDERNAALWVNFEKENIKIIVGQYGPYIKQGKGNFKLPKGMSEAEIKSLTLDKIKDIIKNQPVRTSKPFKKR